MKLIVFGATGKTGMEIVKQSLAAGHEVTAFVRDPQKMPLEDDALRLVTGDAMNPADVSGAIQGHDAVVCSLGTRDLGSTTVRSEGTKNIIEGMQENGVRRLIVVSAMGIGESWSSLSASGKLVYKSVLRNTRKDHEAQEKLVKASGLDWTIVRPSGLTDDPMTGEYGLGENIKPQTSRIPSADVAHFIIEELQDNDFIGKAPTITN